MKLQNDYFSILNKIVIQHDFKIELYDVTNDDIVRKTYEHRRSLDNMTDYIDQNMGKDITQLIINDKEKTIKVFVRKK